MTAKKKQSTRNRPKHVPQRTCIGCRQVAGKRGLIRIVRTDERVMVDPTGKQAGRGAYLHQSRTCWDQVLQGNRLGQALRATISPADRAALTQFAASLPDDDDTLEANDMESDATSI